MRIIFGAWQCCLSALAALSAAIAMGGPASAADLASGQPPPDQLQPVPAADAWTVRITPYTWLPFLVGDVTVRRRTVAIDIDPIQVLDHLTHEGGHIPAWMSYIEARRGPIALYNDTFYANLGLSGDLARTRPRADIGVSAGLDLQQAAVELGGAYELLRWAGVPGGAVMAWGTSSRATSLDLIAGARYWYQRADLDLFLTAAIDTGGLEVRGNRALARSGGVDWVDPLVGLRLRHQLAPGQEIVVRGDVGGFGAGSQFSWQAVAAYSFDIAVRDGVVYSGLLGYRALDVDYEQGTGRRKYGYDVLQHGPLVGITVGF